jgi:hypothetical protein
MKWIVNSVNAKTLKTSLYEAGINYVHLKIYVAAESL